jgi:hypothetical protein
MICKASRKRTISCKNNKKIKSEIILKWNAHYLNLIIKEINLLKANFILNKVKIKSQHALNKNI